MVNATYDVPDALNEEDKAALLADPSQWVALDPDTLTPMLPDAEVNLKVSVSDDEPWLQDEHKALIPAPVVEAGRLKFTISKLYKETLDPPLPMPGVPGAVLKYRWTTTVDRVVEVVV